MFRDSYYEMVSLKKETTVPKKEKEREREKTKHKKVERKEKKPQFRSSTFSPTLRYESICLLVCFLALALVRRTLRVRVMFPNPPLQ